MPLREANFLDVCIQFWAENVMTVKLMRIRMKVTDKMKWNKTQCTTIKTF
jgi:hypothetical protein